MVLNNDLFPHQKLDKDSRLQRCHFPALFFAFMFLSLVTLLETEDNGRSSIWCLLFDFPEPSPVASFFLLSLRSQDEVN